MANKSKTDDGNSTKNSSVLGRLVKGFYDAISTDLKQAVSCQQQSASLTSKPNAFNSDRSQECTYTQGFATAANGSAFTGTIEYLTKSGEKYCVKYENGNLAESVKKSVDGTVRRIKKYSSDGSQKVVETFIPDAQGKMTLSKKYVRNNESIRQYLPDDVVDKWFQKVGGNFIRVDNDIAKKRGQFRQNIKDFYLYNGRELNEFLRSGEFSAPEFSGGKMPKEMPQDLTDGLKDYWEEKLTKVKDRNREIVERLGEMDNIVREKETESAMTVYRRAPYSWMSTAKDGILTDSAYCSCSTSPDAYWGYLWGDKTRNNELFEIILPKGTPFMDLRYTDEKEMLLPRNGKFRIISDKVLEYIL